MSKYHAHTVIGSVGNGCTTYFGSKPDESNQKASEQNGKFVSCNPVILNYTSPDGKYSADRVIGSIGDNAKTYIYKK